MADKTYSRADVEALWTALETLTPDQMRLARILIVQGLGTAAETDGEIQIELADPEDEDDDSVPIQTVFDHILTHGQLPPRRDQQAAKVGTLRFRL